MDFLKKITMAKIGLDRKMLKKACEKGPVRVMRVYGQTSKVEYGSGDNGDWTRFKGQIEAVNLLTKKISRSGALFLPGVASDILEGELLAAKGEDENSNIQFGFEIGVVASDNSATGYEYTAASMVQESDSDVLSAIRSSLPDKPVLAGVS